MWTSSGSNLDQMQLDVELTYRKSMTSSFQSQSPSGFYFEGIEILNIDPKGKSFSVTVQFEGNRKGQCWETAILVEARFESDFEVQEPSLLFSTK